MNPEIDLDASRTPHRSRPAWQAPAAVLAGVLIIGAFFAALTQGSHRRARAHTEAQHAAQAASRAALAEHATQAQHLADLAAALQSQEWRIQDLETEGMARAERIAALEAITAAQAGEIQRTHGETIRLSVDLETAEVSNRQARQTAAALQREVEELQREVEALQREAAFRR